jgi:hypothetical protein
MLGAAVPFASAAYTAALNTIPAAIANANNFFKVVLFVLDFDWHAIPTQSGFRNFELLILIFELSSFFKPVCFEIVQFLYLVDFFDRRFQVVFQPHKIDPLLIDINIARPWIAIPRLSHRPYVDDRLFPLDDRI